MRYSGTDSPILSKDTIGRGIRKVFTEQQKRKIGNFLSTLKKKGIIKLTVGGGGRRCLVELSRTFSRS